MDNAKATTSVKDLFKILTSETFYNMYTAGSIDEYKNEAYDTSEDTVMRELSYVLANLLPRTDKAELTLTAKDLLTIVSSDKFDAVYTSGTLDDYLSKGDGNSKDKAIASVSALFQKFNR